MSTISATGGDGLVLCVHSGLASQDRSRDPAVSSECRSRHGASVYTPENYAKEFYITLWKTASISCPLLEIGSTADAWQMPSLSLRLIWLAHTSSCTPPLCRSGSCFHCSLRTRTGRRRWLACRSTNGCCSPDMYPGPEPRRSEGPRVQSLWEELVLVQAQMVQIHLRLM